MSRTTRFLTIITVLLSKLTMMKDNTSSNSSRRLLSRSNSKRSVSKSRYQSRLDGIHFIKPPRDAANKENDKDSPIRSVLAKALAERNSTQKQSPKKRKSNSSKKNVCQRPPEAEYCHTQPNIRTSDENQKQRGHGIAKKYYEKLSQFSQMQDKIKQIEGKISDIRQNLHNSQKNEHGSFIRQVELRGRNGEVTRTNMAREMSSSAKFLSWKSEKLQSQKPEKKQKQKQREKASQKTKTQNTDISNFVTQVPQPCKILQCSSQTNLITLKDTPVPRFKYYISTMVSAFMSDANTSFMQLCRSHLVSSMKQLQGTRKIQRPNIIKNFHRLPPSKKLNTIVFDLDQTLIHCNEKPDMPHDVLLPFIFPTGENIRLGINIRPFAQQCLKELSEHFEIIIFTASHECYGHVVTDYLDPEGKWVSHKYFRESCYKTPEGYIKDLRVIDRPISNMLMVDNAAFSYAFQVDNGVPIVPYYDCKADCELRNLTNYLRTLKDSKDIRADHCKSMKTNTYGQFLDPIDLLNRTYPQHMLF